MEIPLSEEVRRYIDAQLAAGRYRTPAELIADLVRQQQDRQERDEIDRKLIDGLNNGPATPMTPHDWDELKRRAHNRAAKLNPR